MAPGQQRGPSDASRRLHKLMDNAVALYDAKRYREALALCSEIERLDPSAALPEVMRGECRRARLKRRARAVAAALGVLVLAAGGAYIYRQLRRIRPEPAQDALELAEADEQVFAFRSGLGAESRLEFTWSLLTRTGRPAPASEQAWLKPGHNAPWTCTYNPGYGAVRASASGRAITRRVVGVGSDSAGRSAVRAEWVVRVRDVPRPPQILSATPAPERRLAIAPGGERTFHVEAVDGDGGDALVYEWLVGDTGQVAGDQATWVYRREGEPVDKGPRLQASRDKRLVVCRVSNRWGEPATRAVTWLVEQVPSNRRPEIAAVKPGVRGTIRFNDNRPLTLEAAAFDLDRDDQAHFTWLLDGDVIANSARCTVMPPRDPPGAAKPHRLRLVVTDLCGATDELTWTLVGPE
ncbi:MAG: hypothetical protein ACODAJ_16550 [Planctomycetota bacterium]